jgi:hypothetical protein
MLMLKKARIGVFAELQEMPPHREIRLWKAPAPLSGKQTSGFQRDARGAFVLPNARHVYAIRITYRAHKMDLEDLEVTYGKAAGDLRASKHISLSQNPGWMKSIWVNTVVKQFRIQFNGKACDPCLREIVLLVSDL